ncbi:MAG TPA: polysaccharide biosynthesis/export family protein [Calditrichia bacterium]|nr:polysaccharide biosynthesis/export family protein [Calditrichia bacterium]
MILVFLSSFGLAQVTLPETNEGDESSSKIQLPSSNVFDIDLRNMSRSRDRIIQPQLLEQAYESAIDSSQYMLGPGDQLLVKIWGVLDEQFLTGVTPEGYVIIPGVDEVLVSEKTLSEGAILIEAAMGRAFRNSQFSVRLVKMRKFRVSVVGEVEFPGSYFLRSVDRVIDALQLANGLSSWADDTRIQVRHLSGKVDTVNLSEFFLNGDMGNNIQLQGGDQIYVPPIDPSKGYVILEGNVGSQGIYQIRPEERLLEFLSRVRAINRRSNIDNIVLLRGEERLNISLLAGVEADKITLQNGDRLMVPTISDQVYVQGEVLKPGPYPYLANYTARHYAGQAGILETSRPVSDLYVIRAATGEKVEGENVIISNGDVVVVPRRTRETVKDYLAILTPVISIVISVAAILNTK